MATNWEQDLCFMYIPIYVTTVLKLVKPNYFCCMSSESAANLKGNLLIQKADGNCFITFQAFFQFPFVPPFKCPSDGHPILMLQRWRRFMLPGLCGGLWPLFGWILRHTSLIAVRAEYMAVGHCAGDAVNLLMSETWKEKGVCEKFVLNL